MHNLTHNDHGVGSQIYYKEVFGQFGVSFHEQYSTSNNNIDDEGDGEGCNKDVVSCITSPVRIDG